MYNSNHNNFFQSIPVQSDSFSGNEERIESSSASSTTTTMKPLRSNCRTRKVSDLAASCCQAQSLSLSSSSVSSSINGVSPHDSSSSTSSTSSISTGSDCKTQQELTLLQRIKKMMDIERTNRSSTDDYRAIQDVDQSYHKQVWRERVAQWCYDVLDYLEESRDVASTAMNIIDRYLAVLSKDSSSSSSITAIGEFDYEVISFTALFLAIRVSGSSKDLEISELLQLSSSSGAPQARHILSAGNSMLAKLSWDHQILTPNAFLRELVALLLMQHDKESTSVNNNGEIETMTRESIGKLTDFASYLVEVSVCDIFFSAVAPSEIAFGAIALAMTCNPDLFATGCQHQRFFSNFFQIIHEHTSMDIESEHMNSIVSRLLNVYNQSQEAVAETSRETIVQWRNANGHPTTLPHIITDIVEVSDDSAVHRGSFSSNNNKPGCDILHHGGQLVNTITEVTRPVSPLPIQMNGYHGS